MNLRKDYKGVSIPQSRKEKEQALGFWKCCKGFFNPNGNVSRETITDRVKFILSVYKEARNNDRILIEIFEARYGKEVSHESITRRRRYIQSKWMCLPDIEVYLKRQHQGRQGVLKSI